MSIALGVCDGTCFGTDTGGSLETSEVGGLNCTRTDFGTGGSTGGTGLGKCSRMALEGSGFGTGGILETFRGAGIGGKMSGKDAGFGSEICEDGKGVEHFYQNEPSFEHALFPKMTGHSKRL